ncbi:MAG: efflux transporter periplasmic adaptor subunit [Acidobacteria bacterium]|nr:MAG: efflux transporter periplasmic adaptor subunit [Acidobacteriota bacterium]
MKVETDNEVDLRAINRVQYQPPKRKRFPWVLVGVVLIALVVLTAGILPRIQARTDLKKETLEMAVPVVSVVQPKGSGPAQELVLPANVQAYADAPIYARTNGYLKRWYADIGTHVKAGQLLAEIDTPEVNQQLRQATADLATSRANLDLSKITADRYQGLLKTDSVSKQEADNAAGDYAAKLAAEQSAQANLKRLQDLQSFQKIYAPFEGVITARNTDVGALIDSGSSGGTRSELFHIAQPNRLRVYINVPQNYSQLAKPGMKADLTLSEFPGKRFQGTLVRTANAIDPVSRTLLVEISVPNPTGQLFTGSYAEVHMKLPTESSLFTIPVNTLLFRSEGLRIAVVGPDQKVDLRQITMGRDLGSEVEVVAGLNGNEQVIVNPPDSVIAGQTVGIAQPAAKAAQ